MNYPPGSKPPPPPMSPPPGAPQPAYYPPPPPPPRSGGAMKWVLIGCGTLAGLVLLACGGCFGFSYWIARKAVQYAEAWQALSKESEQYIRENKQVEARLGKVSTVRLTTQRHGEELPTVLAYQVTGEKGRGTVNIEFTMEDFKPRITKRHLYFRGKRVDLETGQEADAPEPTFEAGDGTKVDAHELVRDYIANEVAADRKYKGRTLDVSGRVSDIKKDLTEKLYVELDGGSEGGLRDVHCHFDDEHEEELSHLRKGQKLTVRGRCTGLMMDVQLKDCEIVEKDE